jgi:hypothetical protein
LGKKYSIAQCINIELLIFGKCLLVPTHQEKKHKIHQKNLKIKEMKQNQKDKIEIYYLK